MNQPFTQEADFRQERDFSQKITATFEFIGAHWRPLGRVLLFLVLPLALGRAILGGVLQSELFGFIRSAAPGTTGRYAALSGLYGNMFSSPVYYANSALAIIFNAVLILSVYGYLLECLAPTAPGQPIGVGPVWSLVKRRLLGTSLSLLGLGVVLFLSLLVFVVPGIYLAVALSLFFIVQLVENTGFGSTLNRCLSLTKGKWWSTAGLIFIMVIILYLLLFGVGVATSLLTGGLRGIFPAGTSISPIFAIAVSTISSFFVLLLYPPLLIVLAFQYFNLVERKEGVGLYQLVGQLGQAAPAAPSAEAYRPQEEGEY